MPKLVVLGIDGMDPYVYERLQGDLPELRRLAEQGCFKHCRTVFPPDSVPAWVTIFTAEHPAQHGWLDNIDYEDIRRGAIAYNVQDLQGRTFWDAVGKSGKRVCVINPLMAYPVWPVNGVMTSGPVFISGEKQIYPPELAGRYILPELGGMTEFPKEAELPAFLDRTLQSTEDLARFGLELLEKEPWDLFFISFFTLDRIQHFLWRFWDPTDPCYPGETPLAMGVPRAYRLFDQIVGEFARRLGEDTGLLVISDHGHGQRPTWLVNVNELLRQEGLLKTVQGNPVVSSSKKAIEVTKNVSMTLIGKTLGETWLYRIARLLPRKTRKALKKSSYLIDKTRSLAWASEMGGGAPAGGVELNPVLLKQEGTYPAVTEAVLACLGRVKHDGARPVFRWAKPREEGSCYPDIIFELEPQYSVGRSLYCPLIDPNLRHKTISGGHKSESVLFGYRLGESAVSVNAVSDIYPLVTAYIQEATRMEMVEGGPA